MRTSIVCIISYFDVTDDFITLGYWTLNKAHKIAKNPPGSATKFGLDKAATHRQTLILILVRKETTLKLCLLTINYPGLAHV